MNALSPRNRAGWGGRTRTFGDGSKDRVYPHQDPMGWLWRPDPIRIRVSLDIGLTPVVGLLMTAVGVKKWCQSPVNDRGARMRQPKSRRLKTPNGPAPSADGRVDGPLPAGIPKREAGASRPQGRLAAAVWSAWPELP